MKNENIFVNSEIGTLKRILIHSPDGGIGKVIPAKAVDWLYEDIVDLKRMQAEYDVYRKLLLAYLDPETLKKWFAREVDEDHDEFYFNDETRPSFVNPESSDYLDSDAVVDIQRLLGKILESEQVRQQMVAIVCGAERIEFTIHQRLLNQDKEWLKYFTPITPNQLARVLITGFIKWIPNEEGKRNGKREMLRQLFPPIPNFIFTRDICIVVNDHLLLSKLSNNIRQRESIIIKYIAYYHFFSDNWDKVIELPEDNRFFLYDEEELQQNIVTIEGGDVMMIHQNHLLVGCSERTTYNAVNKLVKKLLNNKIVKKVTAIIIPEQRETMHIDTVFTQIKRNSWVIYGPFSSKYSDSFAGSLVPTLLDEAERKVYEDDDVRLVHFWYDEETNEIKSHEDFEYIEDLFEYISKEDFGCNEPMEYIYCGDLKYPASLREQWTDACNVVAIKEGVVIGYDRNRETAKVFQKNNYDVIHASELIDRLKTAYVENPDINISEKLQQLVPKQTLLLLPSSELSRARGGSHCMSMPLLRVQP
ncbi:MAG: arginine deiminase family protein [Chitinophagales bacterium]|nr:amidinotransferase [Bacteroidota bacterium]MCB9043851.1 amidinotransferase [Chitinophagales bacterium]